MTIMYIHMHALFCSSIPVCSVLFCSSIPVCSVLFCSSIPVCSVCVVAFISVYQTLHRGVHTAHTTCTYIQLHTSQSVSCAGRDEAPKIVKSEEPMEGGRKEPTLEELEVPESTPLAGIPPVPPSLPLSFDVGVGVRLVNAVRSLTGSSSVCHSLVHPVSVTHWFIKCLSLTGSSSVCHSLVHLVSVTHWFI